jgi:hypothetical protein
MSRRVTLPGADELFRSTAPAGTPAADEPARTVAEAVPDDRPLYSAPPAAPAAPVGEMPALAAVADTGEDLGGTPLPVRRRPRSVGERRPTGRERHDEKITVYCSAEELIDIERARLTLRGEYGLAADRGRIVREALAVVLADLEAKGDASILVQRLRGR